MEEQEKKKLIKKLSEFLDEASPNFSQITQLEEFRRIRLGPITRKVEIKLDERGFQVFMGLTRPISLSNLLSWASIFPPKSATERAASQELIVLLPKELLKTKDPRDIVEWHYDISSTPISNIGRSLIEKRLLELFNEISPTNIPEWLESILSGENDILIKMPEPCLEAFIETVKRLEKDFSQQ